MAQHFTLQEAQDLLPRIEEAIREAMALRSDCRCAESELQAASHRIMMLGGTLVNRDSLLRLKNQRNTTISRLRNVLETIRNHGCEVKDLDIGLVDFPTQYRDEEVYFCWRLGEPQIEFWHRRQEGYKDRKKIDQDFLNNHRGDPPN